MPKVTNNKGLRSSTITSQNQMDNLNMDPADSLSVKSNRKRKLTLEFSPQITLDESPHLSSSRAEMLVNPLINAINALTPSAPLPDSNPSSSSAVTMPLTPPTTPPMLHVVNSWEVYQSDPLMSPFLCDQKAQMDTGDLNLKVNQAYPLGSDIVLKVCQIL